MPGRVWQGWPPSIRWWQGRSRWHPSAFCTLSFPRHIRSWTSLMRKKDNVLKYPNLAIHKTSWQIVCRSPPPFHIWLDFNPQFIHCKHQRTGGKPAWSGSITPQNWSKKKISNNIELCSRTCAWRGLSSIISNESLWESIRNQQSRQFEGRAVVRGARCLQKLNRLFCQGATGSCNRVDIQGHLSHQEGLQYHRDDRGVTGKRAELNENYRLNQSL